MTFDELYRSTLAGEMRGEPAELSQANESQLDCLLNPKKFPPVFAAESCDDCKDGKPCLASCIFDAIAEGADGKLTIDPLKCTGCAACADACKLQKLAESKDALAAMKAVHRKESLCYAMIAPAFLGQFSESVTPGKLRSAFKALGFDGMVEVALFADILTLKEALEFERNIVNESDYQLTSCCCPVWIAMIRKVYRDLMPHVPGAVSPMVACGRVIKKLHPGAITVFIGPCVAKKAEARESDVADAVDYVLTFRETEDIFRAAGIDPSIMEESEKEHSSRAGRIYAYAGGVGEAVEETVRGLNPAREIPVRTRRADGVPACRAMIEKLKVGEGGANFYEGMGCVGGCVGGPKAILDRDTGKRLVAEYGESASFRTPLENVYVKELLARLGFHEIDDLLEESEIFTRKF